MKLTRSIVGAFMLLTTVLATGCSLDELETPFDPSTMIPAQKHAPVVIPKVNSLSSDSLPHTVEISDAGSVDPDGEIVKFQVIGPNGETEVFSGASFSYSDEISSDGRYLYIVTAEDNDGLMSVPFSVVVEVEDGRIREPAVVTWVKLRDDVSFFRTLPQNICVEDNGSEARDGTSIRTIHWQTSRGAKADGMTACFSVTSEGSFYIQGEAEDTQGRIGNVKFLSVTVDTSSVQVDTVKVTETVTRYDTLQWRRPIARGRIIGDNARFVGDQVCTEDTGSSSPDNLRITERRWIRQDGSIADGMGTCITAQHPGTLLFVYYVVDEKGNVSIPLPLLVEIRKKIDPPEEPQCVRDPFSHVALSVAVGKEFAEVDVENKSNLCSYEMKLEIFKQANDGGVGAPFAHDVTVVAPGGTTILKAPHERCEFVVRVSAHNIVLYEKIYGSDTCGPINPPN